MKYEVRIFGKTRIVEVERDANGWQAKLDGQPATADAVEIAPNTFSVLFSGKSHEVCITPYPGGKIIAQTGRFEWEAEVVDPRSWSGRRHAGAEAEGRQQIVAPMPGKVVRVLVKAGDAVEAGQGLLVVEAMKMQNEIRSPKNGMVERVLAQEGQAVNAGEVLCVVV
ncbi:MAG TPA: biotin/lipoyl-containing protein [Candidatus Angelobacter sp.]|nr:biotin/lipoyl-containing protein [Candidatus Angelobacter sp.]